MLNIDKLKIVRAIASRQPEDVGDDGHLGAFDSTVSVIPAGPTPGTKRAAGEMADGTFDTLDYYRRLQRAKELFDFGDLVLDWLQSYLAGREHFVAVDGRRSPTHQALRWCATRIGPNTAHVCYFHYVSGEAD